MGKRTCCAAALSAIAAILALGAVPSAIASAKPVRVKVSGNTSVAKAPDGTITASIVFKAKDPACLKISFDRSEGPQPFLQLDGFPNETATGNNIQFQLPAVGLGAYALTLPPSTTVLVRVRVPVTAENLSGIEKRSLPASQATTGWAGAHFKNPNIRKNPDYIYQRKSKKRGRVLCVPKPQRAHPGDSFGFPGP